ncbi:TetR/AcrR family transcriptional regulator [Cryptosporangium phraense]|uniref:TetR/AcrR family transcriptional regulator n=1 Tax=Cryptosporangium phraense TaxID=2593070 RepID=A0A545ANM0_9ACTN|nr:TetR/AcrR family transcriptional regulator [Cryptosporangium phraense]TQS42944.1 TetR/AcrR family transcriptional regulator [Cryptosporangium phraense]
MTRWAGVPADQRKDGRREMLVGAGYRLFGDEGESALTVRAVCREAHLHTRYFYESFADTAQLLGAVYDEQAVALGDVLARAVETAEVSARTRAGVRGVLRFISDDPRRGRVLFADAPSLAARRRAAEQSLLDGLIAMSGRPRLGVLVAATMFTGAMTQLAQQWADGRLGTDLDAVVDTAVDLALALQTRATQPNVNA